jgi:signal transduction histidine kinase
MGCFPMDAERQPNSSLLRLLMNLEWFLLGIVAIALVVGLLGEKMSIQFMLSGMGLGLFAVMGRIVPQRKLAKAIYIISEFGLIFSLVFWGKIPLPNILFIVVVIRNCVLLQGTSRVIATSLTFISSIFVQTYRIFHQDLPVKVSIDQLRTVWGGFFIVFGLVILFLHLLVDAALKERQGQEQLAAANARLRQYALRIEDLATVQERNRIARDIHDSLGHSLTVCGIHVEAALRLLHAHPQKAEALLLEVQQLNSMTLQDVRQSVSTLRADPLQSRSLPDAIAALITDFQNSTRILSKSTLQLQQPLSQAQNVAIYRIIQESLTNIRKYAAATEVYLEVFQLGEQVQMTLQDNGKGFDPSQNTTGFGLQGMQERVLALSGTLEIITAPLQGCCIKVTFPI